MTLNREIFQSYMASAVLFALFVLFFFWKQSLTFLLTLFVFFIVNFFIWIEVFVDLCSHSIFLLLFGLLVWKLCILFLVLPMIALKVYT